MTGPVRDPGLQPERTRLAWRRTTLSCTVAAVLAGKQALQGGPSPLGLLAVAASLLVWLAFVALAHRRIRALSVARPRVMSVRAAWSAAGCVLALTAFSVAIVR
ncbi:DUF202 domain-containing protein [Streptomyces sp. TRM66268-LWL]|uniref:DUF202 domain-containing protein n=1 Tax=Streptomyces polyasparticus TaxID=2767826 RepID=A0ABR7SIZ6_9ACTN|nr:DUF202 domain-containing protein [Streptomyces polyasparticus]MBC9715413.1 DUF202 domain-containing protein [Streptomyces polyasparticus]